jgi:serine/threonine-protein kinase
VPIAPGTWIAGRYRIDDFLGAGSFGEVYRVWDDHQQQTVALKILDPAHTGPWPWNEASQLTRLRSDYILPIWNADVVGGFPFVVTDVATAGSVGDLLVADRISPRRATEIVRHAARGVVRAHDDQIVHRDVKPDNLFMSGDGRTMVGDFGLAYPLDASGLAPCAGTPITQAPEVLAGGPTSKASDVYALGATLYACLAGEFPYEKEAHGDLVKLKALVAAGPPRSIRELVPSVSRSLGAVVDHAMSRDPAMRPTAAELDAALGRVRFKMDWQPVSHPGHESCWEAPARSTVVQVCVTSSKTRFDVVTSHRSSGRHLRSLCSNAVSRAALPGRLRRIFERLGN